MTPQIKQRIEQIRRGEVPEGYKKTKVGLVPEEWEEKTVGKCIIEYDEKTTIENQYPVLTSARSGLMLQSEYYSNNQVTTSDNVGYNVLPRGYITYRSRSDDGKFKFNENTIIDKGIISYFYPVFSFNSNVSHAFMLSLLNHSIYRQSYSFVEGTAQQVLSLKKLQSLRYCVPPLAEQEKIAAILQTQDKVIEHQQKKVDELKRLKKGYLSKMFPKKGCNVPEIRFPGFTDAWEQRKLGEVGSVSMCRRIFKEQTSESGDIPFYKIGTFGGQADAYISSELFAEYRSKYPYPKEGDILISASGSIGRTVEFTGKNEYFQDSNIVWLNHDDRLDNAFLKFFYSVVKWAGIEGSTIKRLYNDNILNTVISMPSVAEQKKIGTFFKELDNLITLHQRKCDEEKQKKESPDAAFADGDCENIDSRKEPHLCMKKP